MSSQFATQMDYGAAALDLNVTKDLCSFLSSFTFEDLPEKAVHEGRRGVMDWIGCALAGSQHPTITKLVGVLSDLGGASQATVLGRQMKIGLLEAPIANGQMGHVLDFDDTHMGGVVLHASSPVLSALLALSERSPFTGRDLIAAYCAGFEAGVRAGQGAPGHHAGGWHLTGTLGSIAAGAAAGKLLGLDAQQLTNALGIAATQAAGMQQNRGTMCKSFHAGKAGSSGVLAALLAQRGFDSSDEILEGKRGFCRIYSKDAATELILDQLGERWEITRNGHKPYACGVVLHPTIDAMIALAAKVPKNEHVVAIELRVNPLAVTITGVANPKTGLKSKFSLSHTAAVSFLDGAAGVAQYTDKRAFDPNVAALRERVSARMDESLRKDQAWAAVVTQSGARYEHLVDHASGTVDNPMSDSAIESKFLANSSPVIGQERALRARDAIWSLDRLEDVRDLLALCA
ncbi:MmgE/PrpD family protein [Microvirga makkahensis]|uniref:MmgE/PrpD family protein n=1 Tax=Microvirga makkahensis TaxID=1128670 RepID=A0A7X3MW60_9HYPH|nr:MmgE/PrpD family protein [Microvirga makkahensis]MXQ14363.1 MmgE/PrpD family protein [Microvirga makkahensis]